MIRLEVLRGYNKARKLDNLDNFVQSLSSEEKDLLEQIKMARLLIWSTTLYWQILQLKDIAKGAKISVMD